MKHYDREQKRWVDAAEKQGNLDKRKLCRGGREHDWVEVLPWGVEAVEGVYQGNPQPYYDAEDAIDRFTAEKYRELEELGILSNYKRGFYGSRASIRHYICSVCRKKDYKKRSPDNQP